MGAPVERLAAVNTHLVISICLVPLIKWWNLVPPISLIYHLLEQDGFRFVLIKPPDLEGVGQGSWVLPWPIKLGAIHVNEAVSWLKLFILDKCPLGVSPA